MGFERNAGLRISPAETTKTKADLADAVAESSRSTKVDAELAVDIVLQSIIESLNSGEEVELRGFGQLPSAPETPPTGAQPKDQCKGAGPCQASRLLQAWSRVETADQFVKPVKRTIVYEGTKMANTNTHSANATRTRNHQDRLEPADRHRPGSLRDPERAAKNRLHPPC